MSKLGVQAGGRNGAVASLISTIDAAGVFFYASHNDHKRRQGVSDERMIVDPVTGAAKGTKLARFDLIPADALWELAEHYGKCGGNGADISPKYEERNWEKGYKWSLSYDAALRHLNEFWRGEDVDPESRSLHVISAAWHCMVLAAYTLRKAGTDNRPNNTDIAL